MNVWHKGSINGHPRWDETIWCINREYFWPGTRTWISEYVKGCATCQQNKNLTHCIKPPTFRIPSTISTKPFSHIAMDLITGLPKREGCRCHTNHSRSWMLSSSNLLTLFHNHHWRQHHPTLSRTYVLVVRTPDGTAY
jgi:hypothetical protein